MNVKRRKKVKEKNMQFRFIMLNDCEINAIEFLCRLSQGEYMYEQTYDKIIYSIMSF